MGHGRAGTSIEEANLVVGSCRELIDDLLIFVHSNKAGLRERSQWRSPGKRDRFESLVEERIRGVTSLTKKIKMPMMLRMTAIPPMVITI